MIAPPIDTSTPSAVPPGVSQAVGVALVAYVVVTYAIALWSRSQVEDAEDFLVAGRRLGLGLAWATLLATWFGAGTLLTAADEVRREGLRAAALEPVGAGLCLVVAGLFFARPLWELRLMTLADFFRRRFGPRAEQVAAALMVPTYFGWIAVQFLAIAHVLELFFGLPVAAGLVLVAVVGTGYTLLGGMWSVTVTDALQLGLLLVGLVVLVIHVLAALGDGVLASAPAALARRLPAGMLEPVPRESMRELLGWGGLLVVAMLGNLSGQDLWQRMFAARSSRVARRACLLAGAAYVGFGAVPVVLGLAARVLLPRTDAAIVPALASMLLSPAVVVVFTVALCSAVMSSIDSGLLSPATVVAKNVLAPRWVGEFDLIWWSRVCVVATAAVSLGFAFAGESAYGLLEDAYSLGLVCLFAPLAFGVATWERVEGQELAALAAMGVGVASWVLHYLAGWSSFGGPALGPWLGALPADLGGCLLSCGAYLVLRARDRVDQSIEGSSANSTEPSSSR